ncbi:unnamed protein product [Dovyalis caffra]|uniref:Uncharacterized protein n=1 Tax=Dovyalis caffra TaxID=77055 RepID=A0AAV1SPU6_9ROSI|nr:unnamed protein product [Dovyalis caffra]
MTWQRHGPEKYYYWHCYYYSYPPLKRTRRETAPKRHSPNPLLESMLRKTNGCSTLGPNLYLISLDNLINETYALSLSTKTFTEKLPPGRRAHEVTPRGQLKGNVRFLITPKVYQIWCKMRKKKRFPYSLRPKKS